VQREQQPPLTAVVFLPPSDVGDVLVLVGVGEVIHLVVPDGDGEAVLPGPGGQPSRHRPRPQHTALGQPEVEVMTRLAVLVQHERLPLRLLLGHNRSSPVRQTPRPSGDPVGRAC